MALTATVHSSADTLRQQIQIRDGKHWITTDEPHDAGGDDSAATPHELLPAALAACIATTVRMYARRKDWQLPELAVQVSFDNHSTPRRCQIRLQLPAQLSSQQRERLELIARKCPVHRSLEHGVQFVHADPNAPADRTALTAAE
jgi:putative redox protein